MRSADFVALRSWPRMMMISQFRRYALAAICCGLALAVAWPLDAPSSCFFLAVAVSALYGGKGPGLVCLGLSALAFYYFFLLPRFQLYHQPYSYLRFAAFLGAAGLIAWLIETRRRVEQARREIDARYRTIADTAPDAIVSIDGNSRILLVNPAAVRTFGWDATEMIGQPLTMLLPEFYLGERLSRAELTGRRKDGTAFSAEVCLGAVLDGDSAGFTGFIRDISARKAAEIELHKLSGRLLRLQDEERRRLARELHDSTAQLLVGLGIDLWVVNESAAALEPRSLRALAESRALLDQSLREIRTVSYLLHPPELDELGLESAMAAYIGGFERRSGIQVDLCVAPDLGRLPQEVETAIFRIMQEALSNTHRHSGSVEANIYLARGPSGVTLQVRDAGCGMPSGTALGVGIASMRERVRQLGGWLDISSTVTGERWSRR
jgi:PAS domain S-box-containing protein